MFNRNDNCGWKTGESPLQPLNALPRPARGFQEQKSPGDCSELATNSGRRGVPGDEGSSFEGGAAYLMRDSRMAGVGPFWNSSSL